MSIDAGNQGESLVVWLHKAVFADLRIHPPLSPSASHGPAGRRASTNQVGAGSSWRTPLETPPPPCPPVSLKSAAPSRSSQCSSCGRPWPYPSIPPHLSRALPPPSRTPLSVGVRRNTRRLICLVATSKPAVAGSARNALAAPRDCAGARRVGEHGQAIIVIGREVPAADVLVEGGRAAKHHCTCTHEAEAR